MKKKYKPKKSVKILFIFIIIIFSLFLYGRYINTITLKVNETKITNKLLPNEYNGLKIAHFSDLHIGRTTDEMMLKKVVNELNDLNADIIIFTGDLLDNKKIDNKTIINYLKNIKARLYKFGIIGDYDNKYIEDYNEIMKKSNFTILDNYNKLVYYESNIPLNFIGISDPANTQELYNNDYFNITLIHKPDLLKSITDSDIAFAGHSLGGQIRLPFIGGIKKIAGAKTYVDSYYKINNYDTYISNGIGTQDISLRTFNSPSITLYRLYNK